MLLWCVDAEPTGNVCSSVRLSATCGHPGARSADDEDRDTLYVRPEALSISFLPSCFPIHHETRPSLVVTALALFTRILRPRNCTILLSGRRNPAATFTISRESKNHFETGFRRGGCAYSRSDSGRQINNNKKAFKI